MAIEMVKIRAKVSIGSLSVETPYILSFNVNKSRGAISTFSASLKINESEISNDLSGNSIKISAGENSASTLIFTGMVKKASVAPCWDDPAYVVLNISGEDQLSSLRGKKYTRRCRSTKSSWVSITGVTRSGLKNGKFKPVRGEMFSISNSDLDETSKVIRSQTSGADKKRLVDAPTATDSSKSIPLKVTSIVDDSSSLLV